MAYSSSEEPETTEDTERWREAPYIPVQAAPDRSNAKQARSTVAKIQDRVILSVNLLQLKLYI